MNGLGPVPDLLEIELGDYLSLTYFNGLTNIIKKVFLENYINNVEKYNETY